MVACAKNLEFEEAAQLRDQLAELKKHLFGVVLQSE
jgi:excinuclease UvrABC helicase subunit UvrB